MHVTASATDTPPAFDPRQLVLPSILAMLHDVQPLLAQPNAQVGHVLGQIQQALHSVELVGPARLAQAMVQALQHPPTADAPGSNASTPLLQLARTDLQQHLQACLDGPPPDTHNLFDTYRALVRLGGKDNAHPADLWVFCGTTGQAHIPSALTQHCPNLLPNDALRAQLDQTLLGWVKTGHSTHASTLRDICLGLAHTAPTPPLRSTWQLAAGWLDAQAHGLLQSDMYAKRLAARLLMLYGQQARQELTPTPALEHELLFFCHRAALHSQPLPPVLQAVCASCGLLPAPAKQPEPAAAPASLEQPAALELQPLARLAQGQGGASQPHIQAENTALQQHQDLAHRLQEHLSAWAQPPLGGESENLDNASDTPLQHSLALSAQLTRSAWEAGWTDISTLAHLLHKVLQRCPALPLPLPPLLPGHCLQAGGEIVRLLQQLGQGFLRRAQPQVVQALEQWLVQLPAPVSTADTSLHSATETEASSADQASAQDLNDPQNPPPQAPDLPTTLQPQHFAVLEEEMQAQWPQLQAALHDWTAPQPCPPVLLRALHTLKGSARLSGAADWASQVHALETLALAADASATQLAAPLEALRLGFVALQQEMDLLHPQRRQQHQPLDNVQRHTHHLWATHSQVQEHTAHSQAVVQEMAGSLQRLRALIQDCKVWANTLMVYGDMDLSYEWHSELDELLGGLLNATDDLGTVHNQLQHHHHETSDSLQQQAGYLQAMQHSLLYASLQPLAQLQDRLQACLQLAMHDSGQQAQLHWEGGDILLERTTLQALAPCLEHLLRNSLAHGLEPPAQRLQLGKPAVGNIQLRLRAEAGQHILELQDDGAGLNLPAIGERARSLGLWQQSQPPSPEEAAQLILHPGLSTASALSEAAGRGMGMDAVQAQVQALGGQLHILSHSGQGCCFQLVLPAPPAVVPMQVLRAGRWQVAIPAAGVEELRRIPWEVAEQGLAQGMLQGDARGPLPLFWAGALWQQSQHSQEPALDGQAQVLVVRSATQRWGLWIDALQPAQEMLLQAPQNLSTPIAGLLGTATQPSGQVVQVYDPAAVIAAYEARQHDPTPEPAPDDQPERPLVMLVDDSISVRRLAQHLLASHGWQVVTAADGLEALQQLEQGLLPSLMLVDIEMPGMNGLELLRCLRAQPAWHALSVVMLTAHEAGPVSQKALDMGAQAYLTKPYTPQQLLAQVRRYAHSPGMAGGTESSEQNMPLVLTEAAPAKTIAASAYE